MTYSPPRLTLPEGFSGLLLHACCAPCSSAILECLIDNGVRPVVFYFNPNIFPLDEYMKRRDESMRQVGALGLRYIDGDYDHEQWLATVAGLENEPERGLRCLECFKLRLLRTAIVARENGLSHFTTTLASSRWKSIEQIDIAGKDAAQNVENVDYWAVNWRKGGLSERRNQLLKENGFYNQQYCGCEFSRRQAIERCQKNDLHANSQPCDDAK